MVRVRILTTAAGPELGIRKTGGTNIEGADVFARDGDDTVVADGFKRGQDDILVADAF